MRATEACRKRVKQTVTFKGGRVSEIFWVSSDEFGERAGAVEPGRSRNYLAQAGCRTMANSIRCLSQTASLS